MTDLEFSILAWSKRHPDAMTALLAGKAAVVSIRRKDLYDEPHHWWIGEVVRCRLDQPVEGK